MRMKLPRLMLAAPNSGGGKTTLAIGLLQAALNAGLKPAAFKCGPDYIDPMFHRSVMGVSAGNLDLFFTDEERVRGLMARYAAGSGIALLEGVMGFYDGLGLDSQASSYHLAQATDTPVVLLLDARGASASLAATLHGFMSYKPGANIQGVILNRCSPSYAEYISPLLRQQGVEVIGSLPEDERLHLGSRHLGLVTADEIDGLRDMVALLADMLADSLDLPLLWRLAEHAPDLEYEPHAVQPACTNRPRLAVARDAAFSFYYRENLDMLADMGAELVYFSPLEDERLPAAQGLLLGGGYPELHAAALSGNESMLASIRGAVASGMPTVAECGGYMYLMQAITDAEGNTWPMVGALPGSSRKEAGLRRFGYIDLEAGRDNLYCARGGRIRGHEFHYWHSEENGDGFTARKPGRGGWECMVATGSMAAGYPHLYYPSNEEFAANFVKAIAQNYQEERQ